MAYTARTAQQLRNGAGTITDKIAKELKKIQTAITDAGTVDKAEIPSGFLKVKLVDGGAAGDITVTGIAVGDELVFVGVFAAKASIAKLVDLTSEFTVAAGAINNATGTSTANNLLQVIYIDRT